MGMEVWAAPERILGYRITVSPKDHVVTVRGAAYFVSLVVVSFRRTGPEWESACVSVACGPGRNGPSTVVWTPEQLDTVPAWLDRIVTAATPIDPC